MSDTYDAFKSLKQKQQDIKNEARASVTMEYYDFVSEMIDSGEYSAQESFLYSVQQFIEEKEYISDKQIEVIDRIRGDYGEFRQPF